MTVVNGDGSTIQVATVVSWIISAVAAISMMMAGLVLNDMRST